MEDMTTVPIVALDVSTAVAALELIEDLGDSCRFYKIGNELFTACGPSVVRKVKERGTEVFLDLKFHDIPKTVAGGVRSAAALGARLVTVHASGGSAMLRAAVEAAGDPDRCGILVVTVLTSMTAADVGRTWGRQNDRLCVVDEVLRLAELAKESGAFGVVCSGHEARKVKDQHASLAVLIPGVRLAGAPSHDQARVSTPAEAAAAGADFLVVGRAVTAAADRRSAMEQIRAQLR
jgi:orotidine-5'-phosphate decarboxylase